MRADKHNNRALYASLAAAGAAVSLGLSGCDEPSAQSSAQAPPPEVSVVTVQARSIPVTFEYVGQTAGVREVEVRPRVTGILERWNYQEGSRVKAGQSLFTIDPAPFQAALNQAQSQLASAEARHNASQRDVERLRPLFETGMVSRKAFDDALAAEEVAAAEVKGAQAGVTEARLNLGYTRVVAPISGVTSRALKSEGSLVENQQTLLTTISQIDPIHVIFSIPESEHLKLAREVEAKRLQLPRDSRFDVSVRLADGTEYGGTGKLDFRDVRVDPTTGSSEARAVLPNPQHELRPGQFVRVLLKGGHYPNAIAVPQRAVLEGPTSKLVMIVNAQSNAEPRPVQVGDWTGQDWIINSGLQPGDRVIVDGVMKIQPGAPVRVAAAPAQPASAPKPDGAKAPAPSAAN